MNIGSMVCLSTAPATLLALACHISTFYGELARRAPTPAERFLLTVALIYGHAAGFTGVEGMRSLLLAVDALDTERIQAAALLDRIWTGVHIASEHAEKPPSDPTACIDKAIEQGLRLAEPPLAWYKRRY